METKEKDESFEIISNKEKYLRDMLAQAEDSLMKSEFNVLINKQIIRIAEGEVKTEADKNAH